MANRTSPQSDAYLVIESDGEGRYRIQTDRLQQIGEQLRGPRRFSVFNSLVLPALVALVTTVLTGTYQYISWRNSIRVQNASQVTARAGAAYHAAAAAIGKRRYATLLFAPSVRDIAAAAAPQLISAQEVASAAENTSNLAAASALPSALSQFDRQLQRLRFETYFIQLKSWNENYDKLLTDIDYDLDRLVFRHAGLSSEPLRIYISKVAKVDCSQSITEEIARHDLNQHSLKIQFAVIHHCFSQLNARMDRRRSKAARQPAAFDQSFVDEVGKALGHVYTMGNEFRCYALRRVEYYRQQKEHAIFGPRMLLHRLRMTQSDEATRHFRQTERECRADNRPT
jgi:hypothetical protein